MKPPRFLLGATLLFWGWQNNLLIWAVPMALLAEAHQFISTRWEFSIADLKRIWNLCIVLTLGALVILYSSEEIARVALKFTQWLPIPLFPILLAQVYGSSEKIPVTVFSWFLRRSPKSLLAQKSIHISFLYFAICLIAASATTLPNPFFYAGIAVLISIALMAHRPHRFPQPLWIFSIAIIAITGHFSYQQLRVLHGQVEGTLARWLVGLFTRKYNINESHTAIGQIGRIHLSGNIVLRLQPEPHGFTPTLLRDASYDLYRQGVWRGSQSEFSPVFVGTNDVALIQPPKKVNFAVRIAGYLNHGRGQLALPTGTYELDNFFAVLQTNRLALTKVEEGPGLLNFVAHFGPGQTYDSEPTEADWVVPRSERFSVDEIADKLNFEGKSDREKIEIIRNFFHDNFTYSLDITRNHVDPTGRRTALGTFLTQARSGHCEYFATATVLLLRAADIPARYATGYLVDESERKGNTYFVRERDAHAWALVYRADKKIWENLDTTPASAERVENNRGSTWESISDFFSNLKFQFSKWRWSKTHYSNYLKWLLVPLVLFLAWRIFSSKRRKSNSVGLSYSEPTWPGKDSEFYLFEKKMAEAGLGRGNNELLSEWRQRLSAANFEQNSLNQIFEIHEQLRFDPLGVPNEKRRLLKSEVDRCLERIQPIESGSVLSDDNAHSPKKSSTCDVSSKEYK